MQHASELGCIWFCTCYCRKAKATKGKRLDIECSEKINHGHQSTWIRYGKKPFLEKTIVITWRYALTKTTCLLPRRCWGGGGLGLHGRCFCTRRARKFSTQLSICEVACFGHRFYIFLFAPFFAIPNRHKHARLISCRLHNNESTHCRKAGYY